MYLFNKYRFYQDNVVRYSGFRNKLLQCAKLSCQVTPLELVSIIVKLLNILAVRLHIALTVTQDTGSQVTQHTECQLTQHSGSQVLQYKDCRVTQHTGSQVRQHTDCRVTQHTGS